MSTVVEAAMKFRKRAEEIRAEAAEVSDPVLREKLLIAANALEEMAAWKPRNPPKSE
jgi:hypothetical protein